MKTGRPIQYNKEQVLEAAMQRFWRQGYEATSLQQLLDDMRLSKSSLYQAFGSKQQLFLHCIRHYQAKTMQQMRDRLLRCTTGRQFVEETLTAVIDEANNPDSARGCLTTNTASEFSQSNKDVAACVAEGFDGYRAMFLRAAMRGQKDGSLRSDKSPETLASFLVTNMSGLRTMVKAGIEPDVLQEMVKMTLNSVS